MLLRLGQHRGVTANALAKVAPNWPIRDVVFFMGVIPPSWRSWSSVRSSRIFLLPRAPEAEAAEAAAARRRRRPAASRGPRQPRRRRKKRRGLPMTKSHRRRRYRRLRPRPPLAAPPAPRRPSRRPTAGGPALASPGASLGQAGRPAGRAEAEAEAEEARREKEAQAGPSFAKPMTSQFPVRKKKKQQQQRFGLPSPPASLASPVRFPSVVLCLVEKRMGATRKAFLTSLACQRGFCVEDANSGRVTHVVSEGNSGDEVVEWLLKNGRRDIDVLGRCPALLDISWFTESMSAGQPAEIEPRHCLQVAAQAETTGARGQVPPYACQRRTLLAHRNQTLTDVLQTMAEEAHFGGSEARSLAFSRAASVLKSLPWTVRRVQELRSLPGIGEHSRRIIQEVLEDGASAEVERVKYSERYQAMKVFTKIFGVGVKTASRWYQEGLRTLADLQAHRARLSKEQEVGLLHYDDLNTPVERSDAEAISQVVRDAVGQCLPGASVTLAGGFRRGKQTGHDVDLLLTHPTEGQEVGLLKKVVSWLDKQGFLLYHNSRRSTFQAVEDLELWRGSSGSTMDHFERCLSIFCLDLRPESVQIGPGAQKPGSAVTGSGVPSFWKAVRVDLVVIPFSQFPFALLGWTGSKNFERDLRRYAKHEKKMTLNSHGLYHLEQKTFLTAASEEEIFQHLDLEYIPPEERNS